MANLEKDTHDLIAALDKLGVKVDDPDTAEPEDSAPCPNTTRTIGPSGAYHELHFEYPAMDLLPKKATPYLSRPKNLQFREAPRTGAFHQDKNDLSFTTRFRTGSTVANSREPYFEQCTEVVEAVSRLKLAPGISNLELVAYYENEDVKYRARLRIRWITSLGTAAESHTFNYTAAEWFELLADNEQDPAADWLDLLQNLTDRASDRAYLHVRQRLRKHDPDLALAHDQQFDDEWDTAKFVSPNKLLYDRIKWHTGFGAELPCGCFNLGLVDFYILNTMSEFDARDFRCLVCNARALTIEDRSHVEERHDRRLRLKAKVDGQCWTFIPAKIRASWPEANKPFDITHAKIKEIINSMLASFDVPESVTPAELCPTNTTETAVLTTRFFELFHQDEQKFLVVPEETIALLVDAAEDILRIEAGLEDGDDLSQIIPFGYGAFLRRWFERVVAKLEHLEGRADLDKTTEQVIELLMGTKVSAKDKKGKKEESPLALMK